VNYPSCEHTLIEKLWIEHEAAEFPPASRCREVAGSDLIDLDYTTAGCISTFLQSKTLDTWRIVILGLCLHSLGKVVSKLDGDEREYFSRLEQLAILVLTSIRDNNVAT
jgi:hypothetical protein